MPYINEHAARLTNPGKYQEWARTNDKFGDGIHAIWGITTDPRKSELQAIRFDAKKYNDLLMIGSCGNVGFDSAESIWS